MWPTCEANPRGSTRAWRRRLTPPPRLAFRHFHPTSVRTLPRLLCCLPLLLACGGQQGAQTQTAPPPVSRPLAWLAGQRIVLTPVYRIREGDAMGWAAQIPRSRELLRALDSAIAGELAQRGLEKQWVYPADLARSTRASPTYTVDPNALAVEPLRNPGLAQGGKIGDPLATQLRTIIAMHDSRMVLLPVELRFDRDKSGQGIAVLRAVLVDARIGDVRWVGEASSDPSLAFSRALLTSVANHFADLITVR
jgi:hypothetical protein